MQIFNNSLDTLCNVSSNFKDFCENTMMLKVSGTNSTGKSYTRYTITDQDTEIIEGYNPEKPKGNCQKFTKAECEFLAKVSKGELSFIKSGDDDQFGRNYSFVDLQEVIKYEPVANEAKEEEMVDENFTA